MHNIFFLMHEYPFHGVPLQRMFTVFISEFSALHQLADEREREREGEREKEREREREREGGETNLTCAKFSCYENRY